MVDKTVVGKRILSAEALLQIEEITFYPAAAPLRPNALPQARVTQVPLVDTLPPARLSVPISQINNDGLRQIPFAGRGRGDFIALTVQGDTMDRSFPPGSIILIDRADRKLISGKVCVFSVRGETTFRPFRSSPARLQPHPWSAGLEPRFLERV
ncbi:MAG: S24 family peptidase [Alphaproteobacteria bacterium]|nr:S24 family peptidase [Alphaproteobacteria bacterium]